MQVLVLNAIVIVSLAIVFRKQRKLFVVLASLSLFFFLALRAESYGVDNLIYNNGFNYIAGLSFEDLLRTLNPNIFNVAFLPYPFAFENGYVIINWLVAQLGFGFRGVIVFESLLFCASIGFVVYKYSEVPWISLFLISAMVFYLYAFSILRQTMALSILLFSIPYLEKRDAKKFILMALLAFLIHRSSIIFLLLYPLCNVKFERKYIFLALALFAFGIVASYTFLPNLLSSVLALFNISTIDVHFALNNMVILQLFIVCLLALPFFRSLYTNSIGRISIWAIVLSLVAYSILMNNETLARADEYYWVFIVLLIPLMYQLFRPHTRILLLLCGVPIMILYLCYQVSAMGLDPYLFFFEG